ARSVDHNQTRMAAEVSSFEFFGSPGVRIAQRPRAVTAEPLIRTKLYRPALPIDHVSRQRLLDLMDRALFVPLTVASAPAGCGKGTLVSERLTVQECRSAWLALDSTESELAPFLNYLLAALRSISADACRQTQALLDASVLPSVRTLAAHVVNDLDRLVESFVLVIDDYHTLPVCSPVHALVQTIIEHAP